MPNKKGRIVPPTPESEIWGATIFLLELAHSFSRTPDAIVVMEGMGESWRLRKAIELFDADNSTARFLIIGGQSSAEHTWKERTVENLQHEFGLRRVDGIYINPDTPHTHKQAEWVADTIVALHPKTVSICVTSYHLIRAYMTILQSLTRRQVRVPAFPLFVGESPFTKIPELSTADAVTSPDSFDMMAGELSRIKEYREQGHVVSADELREYLRWLYEWYATQKK